MTLFTYPSENSPAPQAKTGSRLVLVGWAWSRGTSWLVSSIAVAWLEEDFFPKPNTILAAQPSWEEEASESEGNRERWWWCFPGWYVWRGSKYYVLGGSGDAIHKVGGDRSQADTTGIIYMSWRKQLE